MSRGALISPVDPARPGPARPALLAADLGGAIVGWSPEAESLYGYTAEQALGRHVGSLLADGRSDGLAARERVLAGEPAARFPALVVRRDGERVPVQIELAPRRDESGAVVGTVASVSRGVFGQLPAVWPGLASPVPQGRFDLAGHALQVNEALATLIGEPPAALVGRLGLSLFVEGDHAGLRAALGAMASGQTHFVREERTLRRPDGGRVEVVLTCTVQREADGGPVVAVSLEDVSALRRMEREVGQQAQRFQAVLDTLPVAFFTFDHDGVCTSSRGSALEKLDLVDEQMLGEPLFDRFPESAAVMRDALDGREVRLLSDVGGRAWETRYRPVRDADGAIVGALGIALDVTEQTAAARAVRANEARLRGLLGHASDVVIVLDAQSRLLYVSPAVRTHFGYDEQTLFWQDASSFDHPDDLPLLRAAWRRVSRTPGAVERFESRVRHADGSWRLTAHVLTNLLDDPAVAGIVVNLRDRSAERRTELELERRSLHDGLTGLPGRVLLLDRVAQALQWRRRSEDGVGLVVLDVVGLSRVNAAHGQQAGDELLRVVADRLVEAGRAGDTVARVAGGTFAVLVQELASAEELRSLAATLTDAVAGEVRLGAASVEVALCTGTATTPAADPGALLAAAEESLGLGRRAGTPARPAPSARDTDVAALARGIDAGELRLHLQPVLRLDGTVTGAEVLVRWQHPERGLLLPAAFIPLAESSGLVVALGDHVLREACAQLAVWQQRGLPLVLGVNLSPVQIVQAGFVDRVAALLAEHGVVPARLVLEVTESALMDDAGAADVLRALKALGVRIALDDFGTGYSSLSYLKRFPVDLIKIDRSFVAGLGRDPDDEAIVASVVSLARSIGKRVIAEGVETPAQLEALRALGVDTAQGFLWSPGLPVDELETWLQGRPVGPGEVADSPVRPARRQPPQPADADVRRILQLHGEGASLHTIAAALNVESRRTPGGRRWTTTTVARTISSLLRTG